jgi:hypothetical protein
MLGECSLRDGWLTAADETSLRSFVVGDEAGFAMNGQINTHNVREYVAGQPPAFNFDVNCSQQKLTVQSGSDFVATSR